MRAFTCFERFRSFVFFIGLLYSSRTWPPVLLWNELWSHTFLAFFLSASTTLYKAWVLEALSYVNVTYVTYLLSQLREVTYRPENQLSWNKMRMFRCKPSSAGWGAHTQQDGRIFQATGKEPRTVKDKNLIVRKIRQSFHPHAFSCLLLTCFYGILFSGSLHFNLVFAIWA